MGCSGSKFGSEAESVPAKLRPLLLLSDNSSHPHDFDHKSISSQEDHSLKIAPAPESDETAPKNKIDPNKVAKTAPLLLMSPYKDVNHKAVEAPLPAGSPRVSDKTRKEKKSNKIVKMKIKRRKPKSRRWRQCPTSKRWKQQKQPEMRTEKKRMERSAA
ncbi:hypothetical protein GH714_024852 [Hevea brasiliensis]|uniref:Uncharacterized protein n=1 Tax=Hevea brasiliensis TaxID=3981 RepID=A0A6A6MCX0_HEVBR|nr:hypothetical protein GH714_024852 [Hevea brasiliensis]